MPEAESKQEGTFKRGSDKYVIVTVVAPDSGDYTRLVDCMVSAKIRYSLVDYNRKTHEVIYLLPVRQLLHFEQILRECGFLGIGLVLQGSRPPQ
jgi:hypothetical protein